MLFVRNSTDPEIAAYCPIAPIVVPWLGQGGGR